MPHPLIHPNPIVQQLQSIQRTIRDLDRQTITDAIAAVSDYHSLLSDPAAMRQRADEIEEQLRAEEGAEFGGDDVDGDPDSELVRPCPSCPDGSVWTSNGPTAKRCPTCNGHAALRADGSALPART